jgi:2-oxoisovalerate dehydrogenase E1 component
MHPDETIFTMHRNLGVFTTRGIPLRKLYAQWQGKATGFTKGRDRSFHFGSKEQHIVGMISHLGPQLALADGAALAYKLKKENKVSLVFTGEGATSEGDFHEALNVASVWGLPVIFIIENNGYGLSTPINEQYNCEHLVDRAAGYGMKGIAIEGNNLLDVYQTIKACAEEAREDPKPFLIECKTFRMRGHEEASGVKYVPEFLFEEWGEKDPIANFEKFLIQEGVITEAFIKETVQRQKNRIQKEVEQGDAEPSVQPHTHEELNDVYAAFPFKETKAGQPSNHMRFIDAISEGLDLGMQKHDNLILMGQDIAEYGGVFKITNGFVERYGKERVRNTPLCESAILGIGLGLSIEGMKSMVEMQFGDFVSSGFNQIVNNLAKVHYRWGQNADVVVRMPTGGGTGAGPFHSQSNEAWFTHVPGLKVVYPSNPYNAKGLLLTALEDPNPVLYFEHKGLYRKISGDVPSGYYTIPFGKARKAMVGRELTVITYGLGVYWALETCEALGIEADIIDLRTLVPIDNDALRESVEKTNKVMVLHEDTMFGGIGGEIASWINEHLFEHLDAPVLRCASLDTPVPFAGPLEEQFMAKSRLVDCLEKLRNY